MGTRSGFPTFIIFGSNEGVCVCVDRDKQTNNVEVLDEPCLPTLSLKITIKVVLIESCLLVTFLDEGGSRLSLL
jgi:hypothetical protein